MKNIALLLLFFLFVNAKAQVLLYVAPDGKGDKCSLKRPCSLVAVQQKVADFTPSMASDIIVYLLGGRYELDTTLTFSERHGGRNGFYVRYKRFGDQSSSISGGVRIDNWLEVGGGIYKAFYGGPMFRQLYVNGVRATRARSPNKTDEVNFGPYYWYKGWEAEGRRVRVNASEIQTWAGIQDIEMVIKHHWNQARYRIDRFEIKGDQAWVYFREPEMSTEPWQKGCCPGWADKQPFHFENSIDLLDVPGEWFFDVSSAEVYYHPLEGESMKNAVVVAPVQNSLLNIDGASHLSFEGLIFEHTNWAMPDEARIGIQAGARRGYSAGFIPGGIRIVRSNNIRFDGNVVRFFGGMGIEFSHSSYNNVVRGNLITEIASNGIQVYSDVGNPNPDTAHECKGDSIDNNYITKVARDYTGGVGINATYVNGIVIEHNEIFDLPYTAISIGWGWTDATTNLKNNKVRYNDIHHVMQLHDDGAGIYSLSKAPGTEFSNNYIHHINRGNWNEDWPMAAIYLDKGSCYYTIERNVIGSAPRALSSWNKPNYGNTFRQNWYLKGDEIVVRTEGNVFENNIEIEGENWPGEALKVIEEVGPQVIMPLLLTPVQNR